MQQKKLFTFDDKGNAERFKEKYGHMARYNTTMNKWMYYDDCKWCYDSKAEIKNLADEVVESIKEDFIFYNGDDEKAFNKHLKNSRMNKGRRDMISQFENLVVAEQHEFDKNIHIFNVKNGTIDLKKSSLKAHKSSDYLTKISNAEYLKDGECKVWNNFLNEIFNNDTELIEYIQKAIGYSLSGTTEEQCAFFCYGEGSNGKSTFIDVISDIMGDYATNIQPETIMVKQSTSGATSDIARLKGARFVTCVEPSGGTRLNEGLLKQLTGGDKVTARFLYGENFEFTPEFKLWMLTNHKPIIRGTDLGIWRRIRLVPFTVKIPDNKKDKHLKNKLEAELTGILNWAVEGYSKWQKEGLEIPRAIQIATDEYKGEMDVISSWLEECCEVNTLCEENASELYKSYSEWAKINNEYLMSSKKFGGEMIKRFNRKRSNKGYIYEGLKLFDTMQNKKWDSFKIIK